MKRFISKSERERKTKRKQIIIGVSLTFLMVLSVLGFALQGSRGDENSSDKIVYNGFEFTYINGFWMIGNFAFKYNPEQVPDIGFGLKDATFYQGFPAYIYSENDEAETEARVNLRLIAQRVQNACIESEECSEELPVKTCEDTFIIIRENNISSIRQENNCIYIEGPEEELLELVDQFLFKILGIK